MLKFIQMLSDKFKKTRLSHTRAGRFISDVLAELLRVTWPANDEIKTSTVVVMATLIVVAAYLWAVGWLLFQGIDGLERLVRPS